MNADERRLKFNLLCLISCVLCGKIFNFYPENLRIIKKWKFYGNWCGKREIEYTT